MLVLKLRAPGGLTQLESVEVQASEAPGLGQIKVRIHASSLNYHDLSVVLGHLPVADGRIPLSDAAGEVVAIGPGVTEFAVGDRVISTFFRNWTDGLPPSDFSGVPGDGCDGYARPFVKTSVTAFTKAPCNYSYAEAATLTCAGLTAFCALFRDGPLRPGETVLVQGTGGVSTFALLFAKMAGARVIATSSSDTKLERLRSLGADGVINYRDVPDWGAKALEMTSGRGVDHVIEIGGAGTLPQSIAATRAGGHIAIIGSLAGAQAPVSVGGVVYRHVRMQGLVVGSRQDQIGMIAAIEANGVKPVIDKHFQLEQLADAFRYQQSGHHFGKIAIEVGIG